MFFRTSQIYAFLSWKTSILISQGVKEKHLSVKDYFINLFSYKFPIKINTHDDIIAHPDKFKQLSVRDLLFVYFKCPQVERFQQVYNHYNQITFSLRGERILHQGWKSWKVNPQTAYFQRKTAYVQEVTDAKGWEVLVFHIPDEFLIQFANEFMDSLLIKQLPELTTDMFILIDLSSTVFTMLGL